MSAGTPRMTDIPFNLDASEEDRAPSLLKRFAQLLRGGSAATAIRESLEEVIEESGRESPGRSAQERIMLSNLLKVGELRVGDVMVPRADIIAVGARQHPLRPNSSRSSAKHSIRDCRSIARRSTIRRAKSISRMYSPSWSQAKAAVDSTGVPQPHRRNQAPNPFRCTINAGARPAREDADDTHPVGAGD